MVSRSAEDGLIVSAVTPEVAACECHNIAPPRHLRPKAENAGGQLIG